jgi:hypothetical protein
MARRITVTLDEPLELALRQAPRRLRLPRSASDSERLRAYARRGYEAVLDDERLETYRRWADDPEIGVFSEAAFGAAAEDDIFKD